MDQQSVVGSQLLPEAGLTSVRQDIVLVFPSTTTVLNAEDLLEEDGLAFELIPVPKAVNPNCGLAISFDDQARPEVMRALNRAGLRPSAAYLRRGDDFEPWGDRPFPSAAPPPS